MQKLKTHFSANKEQQKSYSRQNAIQVAYVITNKNHIIIIYGRELWLISQDVYVNSRGPRFNS